MSFHCSSQMKAGQAINAKSESVINIRQVHGMGKRETKKQIP